MTPEYREWLIEAFAPLGPVSVRRVFGFWGLYLDDSMFGLIADERIYLKTDAASRESFEREGSAALSYVSAHGERHVTSYWEVPGRLIDEPDELARWARQAHCVALSSPTAKRKKARRVKSAPAHAKGRKAR
jgi:DNA transformation protein